MIQNVLLMSETNMEQMEFGGGKIQTSVKFCNFSAKYQYTFLKFTNSSLFVLETPRWS